MIIHQIFAPFSTPRLFHICFILPNSFSAQQNFKFFRVFFLFWMPIIHILSSVVGLGATICAIYSCVSPYWAVSVKNSNGFNEMQERYFGLWQYCAGGDHYGTVRMIFQQFCEIILVPMPVPEPIRNCPARSIRNCRFSNSRDFELHFRKRRIHCWSRFFWFCQSCFFKGSFIFI